MKVAKSIRGLLSERTKASETVPWPTILQGTTCWERLTQTTTLRLEPRNRTAATKRWIRLSTLEVSKLSRPLMVDRGAPLNTRDLRVSMLSREVSTKLSLKASSAERWSGLAKRPFTRQNRLEYSIKSSNEKKGEEAWAEKDRISASSEFTENRWTFQESTFKWINWLS